MEYKKIFFPIAGGEELRERIHGALLIGKYFNCHLKILKVQAQPSKIFPIYGIPTDMVGELNAIAASRLSEELMMHKKIYKEEAVQIGTELSKQPRENIPTVQMIVGEGIRSEVVEQESKYSDLVIIAAPDNARITATFEATVTKSGKPVLMFPRVMRSFSCEKILIGWNNSPEASKALSHAIPLLKKAKKVHLATTHEYMPDKQEVEKLIIYLNAHGIDATYEYVETTKIPGQALLNKAIEGNFDLIVAGAFGQKGLKELMLGGTTKYILEHTDIPVFMAH